MARRFNKEDYTIAWICALPLEFNAAVTVLDEPHSELPRDDSDHNLYKFGRVGHYNIIITCLPSGEYGVTSAASVVAHMRRSFPSLIAGLMVGIAGGAPLLHDIRLGDVVVSEPVPGFGGVLQYDFGKTIQEGRFVQTKVLNKPPKIFLTAIADLKSEQLKQQNGIDDTITNYVRDGIVPQAFARPQEDSDRLFQAHYDHPSENASCHQCESSMVVERASRPYGGVHIHYGLIASGNQVMKHGTTRDALTREKGVLCFEMEAAGVMDELPSLVIRGICDYSDSHKNKVWQPYAALSAAVFAKEVLLRLPPRDGERNQLDRDVINLPIAEGAEYGSYADQHKPECLTGTRVDVLNLIANWIDDPQGKSIFWLVGKAGTGKSTISRTVAKELQKSNQLAASFFFNREEDDRRTSIRFFTTIATQIANHDRFIASRIQKAIQADPDISMKALNEQFNKLILQPLSEIKSTTPRARSALVIDALDECEEKQNVKVIIDLLAQLKCVKTADLRVFLTSREDPTISSGFKRLRDDTYKDIVLHKVPEVNIKHDISLFLRHELTRIRNEREELCLPEQWPSEENVKRLVEKAMPLFIYAATICRFIGDEQWDPNEQIETILNYRANWEASQLHMTYLPVLNQLTIGQTPAQERRLIEEFQQVVGTIVNLASPLSTSSLACLLSLTENTVKCRLMPLHSVLDIPKDPYNPIKTFHLSFRDFILDSSIREKNPFWVDERKSHRLIANKCIDFMSGSAGLRKDICNLSSLGRLRSDIGEDIIEKYISSELQYACRYWVYHLAQSGYRLVDNDQVHQFLLKHLLHWLEATSLLNIMLETLRAVDSLRSIIDSENSVNISELIYEIKRFVLQNQAIIRKAPLQTYASALIFTPQRSIIRTIFNPKTIVHCLCQLPRIRNEWDGVQTLEHKDPVINVVFSPDSKMLASASEDETVRLWDTATGVLLRTLKHNCSVNDVVFSPDNKLLASASYDKTVKLWDTATGVLLQTLSGNSVQVRVIFSPDNKMLVSTAWDRACRLWDTTTRILLRTLKHNDAVNDVVFSSDNKLLASASNDRTVKLWEAATGVLLQTLGGHDGQARVVFSPDNKILASTSWDGTFRRWNAVTGELLQMLEHDDLVSDLVFSPDSRLLASASQGGTVKLRDVATGVLLQTLEEYCHSSGQLAFSPDSKLLASTSENMTVNLWDANTGLLLQTLDGHSRRFYVVFSPDNKVLASASRDGTVKLWDVTPKTPLQTVEKHNNVVTSVVFSPDSKILASASADKTAKLWDAATGVLLQTLKAYCYWSNQPVFSPDSKLLASVPRNKTVLLWDTATGVLLRTLKHSGSVIDVVFSPDSKLLASISLDKGVKLWDTNTGVLLRMLDRNNWVMLIAFSHDSKMLASVPRNRTVMLWDTATGVLLRTLKHNCSVNDVVFSPDSKMLAFASADKTVKLWDAATGVLLQTLEHNDGVKRAVFSPDGKMLVSTSWDKTVKVWDVVTAAPLQTFIMGEHLDRLSFSKGGQYLNAGNRSFLCKGKLSSKSTADMDQGEVRLHEHIAVRDEWLIRDGERLIWLPHDYRPGSSAVNGSVIALGSSSGIVSIFNFNNPSFSLV